VKWYPSGVRDEGEFEIRAVVINLAGRHAELLLKAVFRANALPSHRCTLARESNHAVAWMSGISNYSTWLGKSDPLPESAVDRFLVSISSLTRLSWLHSTQDGAE